MPVAGRSFTADAVLEVLASLMARHGIPAHIRSDNGSEFTARQMRNWLAQADVKPRYIEKAARPGKTATPNPSTAACATSFWR